METYKIKMQCDNCGHAQTEEFPVGKRIPDLGSDLPTCDYCKAAPVFRVRASYVVRIVGDPNVG